MATIDDSDSGGAYDLDLLIALYGLALERNPWSFAHRDPRYLEWLTRELRRPEHSSYDWPPEVVAAMTERVLRRVDAARVPMLRADGVPARERAPWPGRVEDVAEDAAARHAAVEVDLAIAAGTGRALWDTECDTIIPLPETVPPGSYLALPVAGDSMIPLLHAGDVVLVRRGPALESGTVVVARLPDDGYVVKRVGLVTRSRVELRSLNPAYPPIRLRRDSLSVVGTVVLRWCAHDAATRRKC